MSAQRHLVLAALGEPTRLVLVERLAEGGPTALGKLTDGLPLSRQAARKHLSVLEEAEVIYLHRAGREQIAELRPESLSEAQEWMEGLANRWQSRLSRFKAMVESPEV